MKWFNNLKTKWGIQSNIQIILILIVFAITGSLSLVVSDPMLQFIGLSKESVNPWVFIPLRLIIVFPVYQVLILIIGFIFGQFKFFWQFEKKMLIKMGLSKYFNLK
ncbi:diacylglyceryl transferase [Flavobacteriales bacterium]|nr:diacylglyceryl transferase [Flavobacteriales bacterium]